MTTMVASQQRLRRVFTENFSAADIAEPLASFDASTAAADVLEAMTRRAYKVAGIRKDGTICGYVRLEELAGETLLRNEALRTRAGFVSRSRGEQTVKELEALRNNLAHSQDIIACEWEIIVKLIEHLDKFLGPPV
ncbi:MAG: hypothetical protein KJZ87_21780 [Thermoguttaceae bacterium]|nr:hypothetical protein [Thermoguttaceae bacterium]